MEIIRASVLGYCMGVKRAVESAEGAIKANSLLQNSDAKKIFTLGPLIHNPSVLKELYLRGIDVLDADTLEDNNTCGKNISGSVVIVRAHGTTPKVLSCLQKQNVQVIDATCPRVHLSQKRVAQWSEKGYTIIIAGDKNHGEVTSISGFALKNQVKGNCIVVQSSQEAESLYIPEKSILIAQTTFSSLEFEKISLLLKEKNPNIVIFNSICSATKERQDALEKLAEVVDGILVIGGRNSANTRRLFENATLLCKHVALIENEEQIPQDFYLLNKVGITAGASTPDSVIKAVEKRLKTISSK